MFKFNFGPEDDIDESIIEDELASLSIEEPSSKPELIAPTEAWTEIDLKELLDKLPPVISFSPLVIPLDSSERLTISRRDLFDARFQLISEGDSSTEPGDESSSIDKNDTTSQLQFVDAPSDLVRGVYEGGLKTWECSLDLAAYLYSCRKDIMPNNVKGKRTLEVGCGTAIPTLYLLHDLFIHGSDDSRETEVHLQDYNKLVLELVTIPNIILSWYMSPLSTPYRSSTIEQDPEHALPPADPTEAGELAITPSLISAMISSLSSAKISLRFFSGSWETFDVAAAGGKYDLVLTSETIYQIDSLVPLISLLRAACLGPSSTEREVKVNSLCLVAAKVLYFGVGGGIPDFVRAVKQLSYANGNKMAPKGDVEVVKEYKEGVGRQVMKVVW